MTRTRRLAAAYIALAAAVAVLFALIQLLTSGGPNHSTDTIMYYIYYTACKLYRYGYGNAMGVVLAVIIAILSAVQFKLGNQDN